MTSKLVFDAEKMRHRLIEERKKRYDNQQQLADALGYSKNAISNIEKEKNSSIPSAETIAKLSKLYGVSADYLLGISDYTSQKIADLGEPLGLSEKSVKGLMAINDNNGSRASAQLTIIEWFLSMAYEYYETDTYQFFTRFLTLIYQYMYIDYLKQADGKGYEYSFGDSPLIPGSLPGIKISLGDDSVSYMNMRTLLMHSIKCEICDCLDRMQQAVENPKEIEFIENMFRKDGDNSVGSRSKKKR